MWLRPGKLLEDYEMSTVVKRLYDDKRRKRQIYVQITSWRQMVAGAKHFYAEVHEDDNPIVSGSRLIYDSIDEEAQGRVFGGVFETAFSSYDAALDWIVEIVKEHFPRSTHKLFDCSGLIRMQDVKEKLRKGAGYSGKIKT